MRVLCSAACAVALLSVGRAALAQGGASSATPATPATPAPAAPPVAPPPMPGIVVQVPVAAAADPAERLASIEVLMARLEDPAKQYRLVGGLTALGLGAATIPISAVMLSRG